MSRLRIAIAFILILPAGVSAHQLSPALVERVTGTVVASEPSLPVLEDPRGQERTFLSFPEWYIVYSAQEYAEFVAAGHFPDEFPYFDAIGQYWDAVDYSRALAGGTVDDNTETVLKVIGISFTVENVLIGAYEKTIGRVSSILNARRKTAEDWYTDQVAKEYGEFLLQTPWYEFAYDRALPGLWSTWGWSSMTIRGMERRAIYTVGYSIKGAYGALIKKATKTQLGSASLTTRFTVSGISADALSEIEGITEVIDNQDGTVSAEGARYRAFVRLARALSYTKASFVSIQGHDRIMLTLLTRADDPCVAGEEIAFSMPILTSEDLSRVAIVTPVNELTALIDRAVACGAALEHIYDY